MSALLGISLWVALATVVPGLVTMAVLHLCLVTAGISFPFSGSEWMVAGIAVTLMVLTQTLGILLEELQTRLHLLGRQQQIIYAPNPRAPGELLEVTIKPYEQYKGLYVVLARLTEHDDSQGHLKRAIAQFFLTNNTLISWGTGVILAFVLALNSQEPATTRLVFYGVGLLAAFAVSYLVAVIRFREMAKSLWAVHDHWSFDRKASAAD